MIKNNAVLKFGAALLCAASTVGMADVNTAADPIDMLYNFQAVGQFQSFDANTGKSTYLISATGRAPVVKSNGVVRLRKADTESHTVLLSNAAITFDPFDPLNPSPVVNFTCSGCTLSFPDGSTLISDPAVPLEGRALFVYGPVAPDPSSLIMSIRMAGCSGLTEVAGVGKLAGKVGSICFNGMFNFDVSDPTQFPATITGESNCTIVMHTPVSIPVPQ